MMHKYREFEKNKGVPLCFIGYKYPMKRIVYIMII